MYYPNPVNNFYTQQTQNQMLQSPQYGQFQFPPQNQVHNAPQIISRPVTNIEEAKASMIEAFTTYLFLDSSNGNIYLKQMNNKGQSDFFIYSQTTNKEEVKDPLEIINTRLSNIENKLGELNYAKSVSNVSSNAKSNRNATTSNATESTAAES